MTPAPAIGTYYPWLPGYTQNDNLALKKPAYSFNTLWNPDSTAGKAVDGIVNTVRTTPFCSISNGDQPWW